MFPVSSSPRCSVVGENTLGEALTGWNDGTRRSLETEVIDSKMATHGEIGDREVDCLVVDGAAPSVDSTAIIERWTDERPSVPVVLLVDGWDDEDVADALSTGATETLPRRLVETDPELLAERIVAIIDRIHARTSVQELYETAAGAAMLHDPDSGEMIHANEALCEFLGYTREELRSMQVCDVIADVPDYDHERMRNVVTSVTDQEESVEIEWPVATADGAVRWVELQLRSVRLGGRRVVLSTWVDITDRRRQERKYEQVFDNVNDLISVHDPWAAELVDVNETMAELLGYNREALLEMDIDGFSVAEEGFTGERAYEIQRRVAATGEPETVEWMVETAGSERRLLEANLAPATIAGEDRVLALSRDVTERSEYERRLERERDRRSVLFENNPDPVLRVQFEDGDPIIREVNPAFEDVFGFSPDEVVGSTVAEAVVPEAERAEHERLRAQVASGDRVEAVAPRVTADGTREFLFRVIHFSTSPDTEAVSDAYVWYTDVTERKRRERIVRRLHESTAGVQHAESVPAVCEAVVDAASEVLGLTSPTCWIEGDDRTVLTPVSGNDEDLDHSGGEARREMIEPDDPAYDVYTSEEARVFESGELLGAFPNDAAVVIPLDDYGLFGAAASSVDKFDDVMLDAARILARHATTALHRVERDRELRESERRFRLIAERIDEVIFLSDPDFSEVFYVNSAYEEIWEEPIEALYDNPRGFINSIDPRDRDSFEDEFQAMLADLERGEADDSYVFEYRVRPSDGTVRWVRATGYPVELDETDGGTDSRFVGIVEDITERRELERTYRSVFENVSDGLVIHDPETGAITDVNEQFCEMNGYNRDELIGETVDVVTGPDHTYEHAKERIRAAREEGSQLFEWRNQRKDGETFPVEVHLSVVDVRGEERVLGSVRDITERKRREREYEEIFNGVNESIVIQDPETAEPVDANQTFLDRLGYDTVDEIRDAGFEELSATEAGYTVERAQELCQRVMETGEPETVEWQQETKAGDRRWIEAKVDSAVVQGEDRILSMQRDITERKRRERMVRSLHEATDDLQNAETPQEVCAAAVDAATEVLDLWLPTCWLAEVEDSDMLTPIASGDAADDLPPGDGPRDLEPEDLEYSVYESGERRICDPADLDGGTPPGNAVLVPLGEHGLFGAVDRGEGEFDDVTLDAAGILARHVTSALDRVERAQELRESERRFRLIAERIDEIVYLSTADFSEILYINPAYEEIYGRPIEELSEDPTSFVEAAHPDDLARYEADVERLIADVEAGEPQDAYEGQYRIERDGETRWVTVTRFPVENEDGIVDRIVGRVQDITERKRREREYEQIFNGVNDSITVHDPETAELLDVNDTFCDLLGYDREKILDMGIVGYSPTEQGYTMEQARAFVRDVVESDEPQQTEWTVETKDGETRWLEVKGTTVEIGGEVQYVSINRDITERRRTERRLSEILDRIDEAIFVTRLEEITGGSQAPNALSAGYEDIWGQSLDEIRETYEDGFFGTLHPDDLGEYQAYVDGIVDDTDAGTAADSYSYEYRIERVDGETRWVQSDFYPTAWENGSHRIVIVSRDITERKRRERRMASFDDATDDLATADTPEEATKTAVEAATDTLDLSVVGAFLYDDDDGVLRPEVLAGPVPAAVANPIGPRDGPLWEGFASGTIVASDGGSREPGFVGEGDDDAGPETLDELAEWRALALGNHGILLVGATESALGSERIQAAHVLAATLEAALNHLAGQQRLAAQEEQLRTQTERAERLDRIARLTQQVEAAITDASNPGEVERAVCERLASSGPYDLAWVGGVEAGADQLAARAVVGASDQYVEALNLATVDDAADPHPAVEAWRTDEVRVEDSLVGDGPAGDWRQHGLAEGYQSLCAIPLTYDGITHGVLTVGSDSPNAFGEREREVLSQLGTSIANALAAIERRRALESDETVELEFRGSGEALPFARAADAADCQVRLERTVSRQDGPVSVYFGFEGDVPDDAPAIAKQTLPGSVDVVTEESSTLVEARTDDWFGAPLAEYGGVLREAEADPGETVITVEVPQQAEVRSFVERLREIAPSLELVARRQHRRQDRTPAELGDQVRSELTNRQFEVLQTAFSAGYFEWPREHDGSEVADRLEITQPTFNKHLRLAERKIFGLLFDVDG